MTIESNTVAESITQEDPVKAAISAALRVTQSETVKVLQLLAGKEFTRHLEIETYTWEQLPEELKLDLIVFLVKEYRALTALGGKAQSS